MFIKDLVLNLFGEGNDVFKEGEWTKSIEMYTEALSIAEYADSEEIAVPMGLLENLYVNRAASYLNIVPVSTGSHWFHTPYSVTSLSSRYTMLGSRFDYYNDICSKTPMSFVTMK